MESQYSFRLLRACTDAPIVSIWVKCGHILHVCEAVHGNIAQYSVHQALMERSSRSVEGKAPHKLFFAFPTAVVFMRPHLIKWDTGHDLVHQNIVKYPGPVLAALFFFREKNESLRIFLPSDDCTLCMKLRVTALRLEANFETWRAVFKRFLLFESLLKTKCFTTILERLYHFKVPKKVKTGEKCPKFQRF